MEAIAFWLVMQGQTYFQIVSRVLAVISVQKHAHYITPIIQVFASPIVLADQKEVVVVNVTVMMENVSIDALIHIQQIKIVNVLHLAKTDLIRNVDLIVLRFKMGQTALARKRVLLAVSLAFFCILISQLSAK